MTAFQNREAHPEEPLPEVLERVRHMEALFDELSLALEEAPSRLRDTDSLRRAARTLSDYQTSGDWLRDYELDERGLLPAGLKRGVLSEDGLYELLSSPELEAVLAEAPLA